MVCKLPEIEKVFREKDPKTADELNGTHFHTIEKVVDSNLFNTSKNKVKLNKSGNKRDLQLKFIEEVNKEVGREVLFVNDDNYLTINVVKNFNYQFPPTTDEGNNIDLQSKGRFIFKDLPPQHKEHFSNNLTELFNNYSFQEQEEFKETLFLSGIKIVNNDIVKISPRERLSDFVEFLIEKTNNEDNIYLITKEEFKKLYPNQDVTNINSIVMSDGKIFIFKGASEEVQIEEVLHPVILAIQNKNKEQFNALLNEIKTKFPEIVNQVNRDYSNYTAQQKDNEIVTKGIVKILQTRKNVRNRSFIKKVVEFFSKLLKQFLGDYYNTFLSKTTKSVVEEVVDMIIDPNIKLETMNGIVLANVGSNTQSANYWIDQFSSIVKKLYRPHALNQLLNSGIPLDNETIDILKNIYTKFREIKGAGTVSPQLFLNLIHYYTNLAKTSNNLFNLNEDFIKELDLFVINESVRDFYKFTSDNFELILDVLGIADKDSYRQELGKLSAEIVNFKEMEDTRIDQILEESNGATLNGMTETSDTDKFTGLLGSAFNATQPLLAAMGNILIKVRKIIENYKKQFENKYNFLDERFENFTIDDFCIETDTGFYLIGPTNEKWRTLFKKVNNPGRPEDSSTLSKVLSNIKKENNVNKEKLRLRKAYLQTALEKSIEDFINIPGNKFLINFDVFYTIPVKINLVKGGTTTNRNYDSLIDFLLEFENEGEFDSFSIEFDTTLDESFINNKLSGMHPYEVHKAIQARYSFLEKLKNTNFSLIRTDSSGNKLYDSQFFSLIEKIRSEDTHEVFFPNLYNSLLGANSLFNNKYLVSDNVNFSAERKQFIENKYAEPKYLTIMNDPLKKEFYEMWINSRIELKNTLYPGLNVYKVPELPQHGEDVPRLPGESLLKYTLRKIKTYTEKTLAPRDYLNNYGTYRNQYSLKYPGYYIGVSKEDMLKNIALIAHLHQEEVIRYAISKKHENDMLLLENRVQALNNGNNVNNNSRAFHTMLDFYGIRYESKEATLNIAPNPEKVKEAENDLIFQKQRIITFFYDSMRGRISLSDDKLKELAELIVNNMYTTDNILAINRNLLTSKEHLFNTFFNDLKNLKSILPTYNGTSNTTQEITQKLITILSTNTNSFSEYDLFLRDFTMSTNANQIRDLMDLILNTNIAYVNFRKASSPKKISNLAIVNRLNKITRFLGLGFHPVGGIAEYIQGSSSLLIEASGGQFFTDQDALNAIKRSYSTLTSDTERQYRNNLLEFFGFESNLFIKDRDDSKGNLLNKVAFAPYSAASYMLNFSWVEAIFNSEKFKVPVRVRTSSGNIEVREMKLNEIFDMNLNVKTSLPLKAYNDIEILMTNEEAAAIQTKVYGIVSINRDRDRSLEGISLDKNLLTVLGVFKDGWIGNGFINRFGAQKYSNITGKKDFIGFYRGSWEAAKVHMVKKDPLTGQDIVESTISIKKMFKLLSSHLFMGALAKVFRTGSKAEVIAEYQLDEMHQRSLNKMAREINLLTLTLASIILLSFMLKMYDDEDEELKPGAKVTRGLMIFCLNLMNRANRDISTYISPVSLSSFFRDTAPALETVKNFYMLGTDIIKSTIGRDPYVYKDTSREELRVKRRLRKIIPLWNKVEGWIRYFSDEVTYN